jgi:hypothetical protein
MIVGRLALAALISIGLVTPDLVTPAAALDLGIGSYRLGMSLEDFRARTIIPESPNHVTRMLCSYEREMLDHMVGVLGYQLKTSQQAGVLVCIFAEPDRKTGVRSGWWEETRVPLAGYDMKWRFWFTGSRTNPGRWELFALAVYGAEETADDPKAVAALQSRLTQELGSGTVLANERYKGLTWNSDGNRAAFLVHQGKDVLDDSSICFGVANLPIVTAINKRLAPSSMRLASLCSPDPS